MAKLANPKKQSNQSNQVCFVAQFAARAERSSRRRYAFVRDVA